MTQRSDTSEKPIGPTEQETAGREANAREIAEAKHTAVVIFSAVASVIVSKALKVSLTGLLAVVAGISVLIMLRVAGNRVWARRRTRRLDEARLDPQAREQLRTIKQTGSTTTGRRSEWVAMAPVYCGLTTYFIAESGRSSSLDAFSMAMAAVVVIWLVIDVILRLTRRHRPRSLGMLVGPGLRRHPPDETSPREAQRRSSSSG